MEQLHNFHQLDNYGITLRFPLHFVCLLYVLYFKMTCVYCCYLSCVVLWVLLSSYVYLLYCVCIAVFTLDAGLLVRSQYSEGPATDHLDTNFSWFTCVYKQMLRWFPIFQVATTCFSCSPPDLNSSSSSSSYIFHGDGPLVDPFRSHVSRSLFKGLPWFLLPVGE